jgi:hypothetical protein
MIPNNSASQKNISKAVTKESSLLCIHLFPVFPVLFTAGELVINTTEEKQSFHNWY